MYSGNVFFNECASFRVVETDFLASTSHFLYIFQRLLPVKAFFFPSSGNAFLNESFIPALGKGFFLKWKPSTLFETLSLIPETGTDMSVKQFLKTELLLTSGN